MQRIKVSFDTWIQLFGMLGVIGGLIFVGLEMQQTQRIAIASQVQARNDALMDFFTAPLQGNAEALEFYKFPTPDLETLSEEERNIVGQLTIIRSVSLENAWQQFNLGMIPEETIQATERRTRSMYDNCQIRPLFDSRISAGFLEYLKSISENACDRKSVDVTLNDDAVR
jgi:hypothetical protein